MAVTRYLFIFKLFSKLVKISNLKGTKEIESNRILFNYLVGVEGRNGLASLMPKARALFTSEFQRKYIYHEHN